MSPIIMSGWVQYNNLFSIYRLSFATGSSILVRNGTDVDLTKEADKCGSGPNNVSTWVPRDISQVMCEVSGPFKNLTGME